MNVEEETRSNRIYTNESMSSARWVQMRCLEALGTKQDGAASVAFAQKGASQIYSSQISKKKYSSSVISNWYWLLSAPNSNFLARFMQKLLAAKVMLYYICNKQIGSFVMILKERSLQWSILLV